MFVDGQQLVFHCTVTVKLQLALALLQFVTAQLTGVVVPGTK